MSWTFVFFLLFLLSFSILNAQQVIIKGRVVNKEQQPIEYVHISVRTVDSITIRQYTTDESGIFYFELNSGRYNIRFEKFGQSLTKEIDAQNILDLGDVDFWKSEIIDEVRLIKKKKRIEKKVDRIVFNVENAISLVGSTALDALASAPRIIVQNDKISMIGRSYIMLMIDNRLVPLSQDDLANYLKSISSDTIKSIEVIPNPPAQYSAEGNSGIVNIITKAHSMNNGWNGVIRSTYQQASYARGTFGTDFNIKTNKLQAHLNLNYSNGSLRPIETGTIEYPKSTWDNTSKRRDFIDNFSWKGSLNYKISNKISTGLTFHYTKGKPLIKEVSRTNIRSLEIDK